MAERLLLTIECWRAGWSAYLVDERDDNPRIDDTAWEVLKNWDTPAETREGALAALSLAIEHYEIGETPVIPAMMKAAFGFLDGSDGTGNINQLANTDGGGPLRRFIVPLRGPPTVLETAIDDHRRTLAAWRATSAPNEDLECEGEAYKAFTDAEYAFVEQRCFTSEEIQHKLAYVAECREMADAIKLDSNGDGTSYQTIFLKSLMLPQPVDSGGK